MMNFSNELRLAEVIAGGPARSLTSPASRAQCYRQPTTGSFALPERGMAMMPWVVPRGPPRWGRA
jgi:hypothetical protein